MRLSTPSVLALTMLSLLLLPACEQLKPASVPVARRPDAGLLQPCEGTAEAPERPTTKEVSALWLEAERLLVLCAERLERLIDFDLERKPAEPKPQPPPAAVRPRLPVPLS